MKRPIQSLAAAALAGSALMPASPALAAGPGFDCAKATRQVDKAICAWDTVGALDGKMAAAYKAAMAVQDGKAAAAALKADQRAWLAERDRRCALNNVKPRQGSEEGLGPREFGQLICLQALYPPRIARLMDFAAPPLAPRHTAMLPIEPLKAAYPDDWRQARYQAQFSPDKTLMALGIEDDAGYVKQVWLYQPASGRLVAASPRTHKGKIEKPGDIAELRPWVWGGDGRFYLRAYRPLGQSEVFGADMKGYSAPRNLPPDVAGSFAAYDAARKAAPGGGAVPEAKRPPGFDDNSYDEQQGGAYTAWAQNKGHGSFDLMAARDGAKKPRVIASGGWELRDFLLDPSGRRLFYNGEDGLVVTDPGTGITRRVKGTRGTPSETRPINMSADGEILVYSAGGACTRDASDEIDPDADDDSSNRVCLAYLLAGSNGSVAGAAQAVAEPSRETKGASQDTWLGKWHGSGEGNLSADIRNAAGKPGYLVVDLYTGVEGCSGAVTLYGKPKEAMLLGEAGDQDDSAAPGCRVELSLDAKGALKTEVAGPCTSYHGAACGFDGVLLRDK